jgi:hypothetical protein
MPRNSPIPPYVQQEIVTDYAAGLPTRAIGAKYQLHHSTVVKVLKRSGQDVRRVGRPQKEGALTAKIARS